MKTNVKKYLNGEVNNSFVDTDIYSLVAQEISHIKENDNGQKYVTIRPKGFSSKPISYYFENDKGDTITRLLAYKAKDEDREVELSICFAVKDSTIKLNGNEITPHATIPLLQGFTIVKRGTVIEFD